MEKKKKDSLAESAIALFVLYMIISFLLSVFSVFRSAIVYNLPLVAEDVWGDLAQVVLQSLLHQGPVIVLVVFLSLGRCPKALVAVPCVIMAVHFGTYIANTVTSITSPSLEFFIEQWSDPSFAAQFLLSQAISESALLGTVCFLVAVIFGLLTRLKTPAKILAWAAFIVSTAYAGVSLVWNVVRYSLLLSHEVIDGGALAVMIGSAVLNAVGAVLCAAAKFYFCRYVAYGEECAVSEEGSPPVVEPADFPEALTADSEERHTEAPKLSKETASYRFCPICGGSLAKKGAFCPHCGNQAR